MNIHCYIYHIRRLALVVSFSASIASVRPANILSQGDDAVLAPPVAEFRAELDRLQLRPEIGAVPTVYDSPETNLQVEIEDLKAALHKAGRSDEDIESLAAAHFAERRKLLVYDEQVERSDMETLMTGGPAPAFPQIHFTEGLPPEFADYLEGSLAWHNPTFDKSVARPAWERLLNRPPEERRYKSVWAAYMLGRSWEKEDPDESVRYYEQVRTLARAGFSDRLGFAVGSLGQEARVFLQRTNFVRAIDLYLRQLATGENSGYVSLTFTMRALFRGGTERFPALAQDAAARRVVTAYIISTKALRVSEACGYPDTVEASNHLHNVVHAWLTTAEAAAAKDSLELREELALAAYQNGDWELAQHWVDRSGGSAVAHWIQVKLLFHAKRFAQAGALLERIQPLFPLEREDTNAPLELKDNLTSEVPNWDLLNPARQVRAELGVLAVSRGDYAAALTHFLDANLWGDAAYVAERLLSLDELKAYVDRNVPEPKAEAEDDGNSAAALDKYADSPACRLRDLLARRLMRNVRGNEAREYYLPTLRSEYDELAKALTDGWNESNPPAERARALFTAAQIVNTNGFELLSTEVGPDWHIADCEWEGSLSAGLRQGEKFTLLPAAADEVRRYNESAADPDKRFHYRYQAARLGWEAAKLMPDNSDETAKVLHTVGTWIKYLDPATADLFYKALVIRCGKTGLGHEADVRRWFPRLDEDGNILPPVTSHAAESKNVVRDRNSEDRADTAESDAMQVEPPPPPPSLDGEYIIHAGDTLELIAKRCGLTFRAIVDSNPGWDPRTLKIGQRLVIPTPLPPQEPAVIY